MPLVGTIAEDQDSLVLRGSELTFKFCPRLCVVACVAIARDCMHSGLERSGQRDQLDFWKEVCVPEEASAAVSQSLNSRSMCSL